MLEHISLNVVWFELGIVVPVPTPLFICQTLNVGESKATEVPVAVVLSYSILVIPPFHSLSLAKFSFLIWLTIYILIISSSNWSLGFLNIFK